MTTPTVPPVTCQIEIDPLAPPCGTGLEGWGGELPEPVLICLNGETVNAAYWGQVQQATTAGQIGPCAAIPTVVAPGPVLPVTGTSENVAGIGSVLLLTGCVLVRLASRLA